MRLYLFPVVYHLHTYVPSQLLTSRTLSVVGKCAWAVSCFGSLGEDHWVSLIPRSCGRPGNEARY